MTGTTQAQGAALAVSVQIGDVVALLASVAVLVAYAALPLRGDGDATGLAFLDSSTTFPALTLAVGVVGAVTALVGLTAVRERAMRWWFAGLGILGLVFLFDNALRGKAPLSSGGTLAMLGCAAMIVQAALPRSAPLVADRTADTVLGLIRIIVGTLWFTQLLWKLPWNNFGCPAGPLVPAANASGLCDWIGRELANPRWPLYKSFLEGVVAPNLGWLAFFILAGEAFTCFSLLFGLFTRTGGLIGTLMGINLFIGLTAVPNEWDWTYLMLIIANVIFVIVGGRYIGLDAILNPRLRKWADSGSRLARVLAWTT